MRVRLPYDIGNVFRSRLNLHAANIRRKKKIQKKELFAKVDYELKEIPKKAVWDKILVEGSCWAYPDETSFRKQLRKVRNNYNFYKKQANELKVEINKSYSKEIVLSLMAKSILEDIKDINFRDGIEEIMVL